MTKTIFFILFLTVTLQSSAQKSLQTLVKENEKSVFLVQCFDENNQMVSTGSGFFIDKSGIAFTNVHVIKDVFKAKIKTVEGKYYDIEKIIDYNSNLDIAKIKVKNIPGISFPALKVSNKKAEKGETIFTIGNPDGLESSVSTGIISSIRAMPDYGECYQITAPISPGSSGGALFNMSGEIIGMTTFGQIDKSRLNQNLNFAVNIINTKYLNQNLNLSVNKASLRISYENFLPEYMRFYLSGDYKNAINICTEQINAASTSGLAYHLRATSRMILNELTLAEGDFQQSLIYSTSNETKEWDYIGLGKIFRKSGQFEKSKDYYLKALKINDGNATTYCNLAILAKDWLGPDHPLVESSYINALEIDPTSCSFGYKTMGEKLLKNGEYEKAITFLSKAIEIERDNNLSINEFYNRGTCFYQLKKYNDAILDFKTCLSLMPNDIQSYLWLGLAYYAQGKKLEACNSFNRANEINNSFGKDKKISDKILNYLNAYCN